RDARSPKLFYLAVGFKLEKLVVRCEIAYLLTKNGKFQDQQWIEICKENIVDLQMPMAKKDLAKDNEKRSCELATDFTHLQLQPIHKIMTLKFALNQTRKVLSVREKNPIDEHPLNYDEHNPFNICAASNVPHLSSFKAKIKQKPILKTDFLKFISFVDNHYGDGNLDSTIEKHGLNGAFPGTVIITTMKRETQHHREDALLKNKFNNHQIKMKIYKTETISKICGDKHHTTVKQDGKIIREYGNVTMNELNQIDKDIRIFLKGFFLK
ncbi:unnamed protein product, partial [Rotaria sp. Silwood1]